MANDISGTITIKIIATGSTAGEGVGEDFGKKVAEQVKKMGGERFSPFPPPPFKMPRNMWPAGMFGLGGFSTQQTAQREEKEEEKKISDFIKQTNDILKQAYKDNQKSYKEGQNFEKQKVKEFDKQIRDESIIANRIQKEEGFWNKPAMKSLTKFLPTIAGVAGIAGILGHSKIISQTSSAIAQLLGALVDVLLAPLVPLLIPVLKGLVIIIQGVQQLLKDPIGFLMDLWEKFMVWLKISFLEMIDSIYKLIPGEQVGEKAVKEELDKLKNISDIMSGTMKETSDLVKGLGKIALGAGLIVGGGALGAATAPSGVGVVAGAGAIALGTMEVKSGLEDIKKSTLEEAKETFLNFIKWTFPFDFGSKEKDSRGVSRPIDIGTMNVNVIGAGVLTPEELGRRLTLEMEREFDEAERRGS